MDSVDVLKSEFFEKIKNRWHDKSNSAEIEDLKSEVIGRLRDYLETPR